MNTTLVTKIVKELEDAHKAMRQVKNVLRVPRLYAKYQESLREVEGEQQMQAFAAAKFMNE